MTILPNIKDILNWKKSEFRWSTYNTTIWFWYTYYKESDAITIPEYQRDYIWSQEQKENFIRSLFYWVSIPPLILNKAKNWLDWIIVDWSQRFRTLKLFFENKLIVDGVSFDSLEVVQRRRFLNKTLSYIETNFSTEQEEKEFYRLLNTSGTQHTKEEIQKAR